MSKYVNMAFRVVCCIVLLMAASKVWCETDQAENTVEVNLLENGGLEKWIDFPASVKWDIPDGWLNHNNANVKKENKTVCEGNYSAKMQSQEKGSTARVDQRIEVSPGHKIRIRFSYYVEQWKSKGARTYCYFRTEAAEKYNIPAEDLQAFYGKEQYYIIRGGGNGKTYLPGDLNMWQTFDETIEVPPTAHYFVFGVNSYFGTTMYVDDCWVTDVTGSATIGDANGDGKVDIVDVTTTISYILGQTPATFDQTAADVNGDGKVDIVDVTSIIDIILKISS